jgi:hypothetical protein
MEVRPLKKISFRRWTPITGIEHFGSLRGRALGDIRQRGSMSAHRAPSGKLRWLMVGDIFKVKEKQKESQGTFMRRCT